MSWNVEIIRNTWEVPKDEAFRAELVRLWVAHTGYDEGEYDLFNKDGTLYFNPDDMEHIDYLEDSGMFDWIRENYDGIQVGDICFGDIESVKGGKFWGYRIGGGKNQSHKLKGKLVWSVE